ncbi:hypothetical protein [Paracoccus denitrificans]|uniref:hypothetical protein n=1 Tax=Paracoccus denitrificans TaxID=266 RepID=UPI00131A3BEA|nr:hypothetical protein [Paracoccus denitrificans]
MKAGRSIAVAVVLAWFNCSPFSGEKLDTVEGLKASGNIARARTALFLMTTARRLTCAGPGGDNDTLRAHHACTKLAAHPSRMNMAAYSIASTSAFFASAALWFHRQK